MISVLLQGEFRQSHGNHDEWNVDSYVADICSCPVYDGKESHCSI